MTDRTAEPSAGYPPSDMGVVTGSCVSRRPLITMGAPEARRALGRTRRGEASLRALANTGLQRPPLCGPAPRGGAAELPDVRATRQGFVSPQAPFVPTQMPLLPVSQHHSLHFVEPAAILPRAGSAGRQGDGQRAAKRQ